MTVERNLLISLLKLTKNGSALIEDVNRDAHLPAVVGEQLLDKMQAEDLIYLESDKVQVDSAGRMKLAVKAATLGADIERISDLLGWKEFEEITVLALKNHGYAVKNNVRFKHGTRRWEIDVVGCRKPLVVCIDCKHWQHAIAPSALKKIVDAQIDRTHALADSLPNPNIKLDCALWEKAKFIPAVLSLFPSSYKFIYQVPIVPVLQLQNFICQLPVYTEDLKVFPKTFTSLSHDFKD